MLFKRPMIVVDIAQNVDAHDVIESPIGIFNPKIIEPVLRQAECQQRLLANAYSNAAKRRSPG